MSVRNMSIINVNGKKEWDNGWTLNGLSSGKYSTFNSIDVLDHFFVQLH